MIETKVYSVPIQQMDTPACRQALIHVGEILKRGGLAAIPTETVYGLAADAGNPQAVKSIFTTKGRPQDNPLIVHIASMEMWKEIVQQIPSSAIRLAEAFWPGPLTIILPKSERIPLETSGGLNTVAVRFPSHPVAQEIIRLAGVPIAAPSANLSGLPSPTTAQRCIEDLSGKVEAIVDAGSCSVGVESTVITLAQDIPRLLRPGGITLEQLQTVLGQVAVDPAVTHRLEEGQPASSPGMKYKHYAPKADVRLVEADQAAYLEFVNRQEEEGVYALCFSEDLPAIKIPAVAYGSGSDPMSQAHGLFESLRRLDELGARMVYARAPSKDGVGLAVYNRLIRAAGFSIVYPSGGQQQENTTHNQ